MNQPSQTSALQATHQVLAEFHETRLKQKAEEAQWEHYRREADPPWPFVIATGLIGFAGMVALAAYLLANPSALRSPLIFLIIPVAAMIQLIAKLVKRREKALVLVVKEQAPQLFEKLKAEQLIR